MDTSNVLLTNIQENNKIMQTSLKEMQQNSVVMMKSFAIAIGNDSNVKDNVGNWCHRLVLNKMVDDIDPIPKPISEENLRQWYVKITNKLGRLPWLMDEGSLVTVPISKGSIARCSASYKL